MRVRQAFVGVVGSLVLLSASSAGAASVESPDPAPPAIATPSATAEASSAPARIDVGAHFGMGELAFRLDRYSFWGRSYPVEAWVGFSLTNRLALFGQFYDAHLFDPSSSFAEVTNLNLLGLGVGLKYDLTSTHLYLSGSLLFSRVTFGNGVTDPNAPPYRTIVDEQTHWGGMGRLALGKDWQMSRGWRLGLEGDVVLGWMDFAWSSGGDDRMSSVRGFSLLGSASYAYDLPRTSAAGSGKVDRRSFYVEARAGVGYLWTRFGVDSVGGRSYPFGLSVGWAVGRRAVFLGDVSYAPAPSLKTDVYPELESGKLYTAGPRVKYYLTPSGLFLSGALLVSRIDYRYESSVYVLKTHWGLSGEIAFGKEWRFADTWGVGIAGDALLGRMSAGEDGAHFIKGLSIFAFANVNYPKLTDELPNMLAAEPRDGETPDTAGGTSSDGRHTHDGVYMGARLGVGWLDVSPSYADWHLSGWGWPFALSLGFAVTRSLVVFGEFYQLQVRHPAFPFDFDHLADLELVAVGPGVTYYVPGINAFASLSTSLSQVSYRNGSPSDTRYGTNETSNWGLLGRLSLGKEFWVSSNWGLGLAVEGFIGRMGARTRAWDNDFHFTAKGFAFLATASFN